MQIRKDLDPSKSIMRLQFEKVIQFWRNVYA